MRSFLPWAALLGLTLQAQAGPTHLNVSADALIEVSFIQDTASGFAQLHKLHRLIFGNGVSQSEIPPGKVLILREAEVTFTYGARTAPANLRMILGRAGTISPGSYSTYGGRHTALFRLAASTLPTEEMVRLDLPSGVRFTNTYRLVVVLSGTVTPVSGVQVQAWGYLADDPAQTGAAPLRVEETVAGRE